MKILITGAPGVGKTALLSKYKAYSLDKQNKDVWIKKGSEYYEFIKNQFGDEYVNDQELETAKVGKLLFNNPEALAAVDSFVKPIIRKWIKELPANALIEFGHYINNESKYQDLVDKVILITNSDPELENKFTYLEKESKPRQKIFIKTDYVVDNTGFKGQEKFDKIINEIKTS